MKGCRGVMFGLLFSIPIYAGMYLIIWLVLRWLG